MGLMSFVMHNPDLAYFIVFVSFTVIVSIVTRKFMFCYAPFINPFKIYRRLKQLRRRENEH